MFEFSTQLRTEVSLLKLALVSYHNTIIYALHSNSMLQRVKLWA